MLMLLVCAFLMKTVPFINIWFIYADVSRSILNKYIFNLFLGGYTYV